MSKQRINKEVIEKIELGEYTYKQLCDLGTFIDGAKTSNAKKAQITDLEQYFDIDYKSKRGKIIVIDKKENFDKKTFTRIRGGKYSDDIQELLLKSLYDSNEEKVQWSINTILDKLSMINEDYIKYRKDMFKLSQEIECDKSYIKDFYSYNHAGLRQKVETALNNLRKRSLVMWSKITMINMWEVEIVYSDMGRPAIDESGQVICNKNKVFRKANDKECRVILKSENNALKKLKCDNKGEIVSRGLWKEFNELIYNGLSNTGICFYYNAYEIIFNRDIIEKEVIGDLGASSTKIKLNNKICNGIIESSKTRHENALDKQDIVLLQSLGKNEISESSFEKNMLLCNEKFIDINGKLVDKLIKIK